MFKKQLLLIFYLYCNFIFGQLVINEIDADTPGVDTKEFIEIKSNIGNFSLNGYVLVLFNGSDSKSYLALDLDAITTNINGIATLGNSAVSPVCNRTITNASIQNGPDAVAVYIGNASNFPTGTLATSFNLVHAVAYGTSATSITSLMSALNLSSIVNENMNSQISTQSIQRKNDGTFEAKAPTPGLNNDGTGSILNAISITILPTGNLLEGNSFVIDFATALPVVTNLSFSYSLANGAFSQSDYSADLNVIIPAGASFASKTIQLIDDTINEGDEELKISFGTIPANYTKTSDNVLVRVNDNDNLVQPWGTPINPTYGLVASTRTSNYYSSLDGKSGVALKQAIQNIIANPSVVRKYTYGDVYEIIKISDQNPANSSQVWLMYSEQGRSKLDQQTSSSGAIGFWNREHIYPQSRGGFTDATSPFSGNINSWLPTDFNDIVAGHSDAHHIRAEDSPENSIRSNRNYGIDYNGPTANLGSWKGDVARAIFYMCVRYNGLNVINGNPAETPDGFIGDLATLLQWNATDTADDFEMNRNNYIQTWQQNRNPFIDFPNLANYVFGNQYGQTWSALLSNQNFENSKVVIYPNPAKNSFTVVGIDNTFSVSIFNISGQQVFVSEGFGDTNFLLDLAPAVYLAYIKTGDHIIQNKIVIY